MNAALVLAGTNLRRMARDRSTLFFTVLFPLAIILVIGLSIGGVQGPPPIGLHDASDGPLSRELAASMRASKAFDVRAYDSAESLRTAVRRGTVSAGVIVPAFYDTALRGGLPVAVQFVSSQGSAGAGHLRSVTSALASRQGARVQAAHFATRTAGGTFDANLATAARVAEGATGAGVEVVSVGEARTDDAIPQGFAYTAPSNLTLFVFITSLAGAGLLIDTRRLGLSRRMLATPASAASILTGEALARLAIALGQAAIIFVAGAVLFSVDWGDPLGAVGLIVAFCLVSTGAAMLLGSVLRTPEQTIAIGMPAGIALGMLGGCMWPLEIVPSPMRALGHLFPHAWAMDGFIELVARGAGPVQVLPNVLALLAFAAVLIPLATWRLRAAIVT